jgi:hypothetical protein
MHNVDTLVYYGGYPSLLIQYDRTPTPAAVATSVTAHAMDGLKCLPCAPVEGLVQGVNDWEIGIQLLFVLSEELSAAELATAGRAAIQE